MPRLPRYEFQSSLPFLSDLLTPHALYLALDNLPERRQAAYRALFQVHIDNKTLEDIRQATQKGWALGNDRF